ncbi:MAG: hypothetical protein KatS3mg106_300 [Gemmataceae bacterium]|nr:MAG: hypothetical protein KatS3mg106_300 [Gemmataceae bacterium]
MLHLPLWGENQRAGSRRHGTIRPACGNPRVAHGGGVVVGIRAPAVHRFLPADESGNVSSARHLRVPNAASSTPSGQNKRYVLLPEPGRFGETIRWEAAAQGKSKSSRSKAEPILPKAVWILQAAT